MKALYSPKTVRFLLAEAQIRPRKKWGQNFMVSSHAVDLMMRSANIKKEDVVIEIGPGLGVLTERLLQVCKSVFSIEIDRGLAKLLPNNLEDTAHLILIEKDFLKIDLKDLFKQAKKKCGRRGHVRLVSNLPYSVTTPVLTKVIESGLPFKSITVTVQEELANRLVAKPGTKNYGSITVLVQYHTHPTITGKIKPVAFYPPPKVGSVVLDLQFYSDPPVDVKDEALFFKIVRTTFCKRRKMLRNNLQDLPFTKEQIAQALKQADLAENRRPESLSLKEFALLSNHLR